MMHAAAGRRVRRALLRAASLSAVLAAASPLHAQRTVSERRAAPHAAPVRIHHDAGSVRVIGWDVDSIAVSGTVSERGGDGFYMAVSPQGSKLGIWATMTDTLAPSHLEIRVPRASSVWIKTVTADASVSGITGGIDAYSVAGALRIEGAPHELHAETMGGAIHADVSARAARLKSGSGAIELRGRIDDAAVQNVSGSIVVAGGGIVRGRFESVDGDVRYEGSIPRAAQLDFVNHAGAVVLLMPAETRAQLFVNTYAGELENGFAIRPVQGSGRYKGQEYTLALHGGGAQVTVRTFKGDVILRPTQ